MWWEFLGQKFLTKSFSFCHNNLGGTCLVKITNKGLDLLLRLQNIMSMRRMRQDVLVWSASITIGNISTLSKSICCDMVCQLYILNGQVIEK